MAKAWTDQVSSGPLGPQNQLRSHQQLEIYAQSLPKCTDSGQLLELYPPRMSDLCSYLIPSQNPAAPGTPICLMRLCVCMSHHLHQPGSRVQDGCVWSASNVDLCWNCKLLYLKNLRQRPVRSRPGNFIVVLHSPSTKRSMSKSYSYS